MGLVEREPRRERLARVPEAAAEAGPLAKGRAQLYVRGVVARVGLEPALQFHDFVHRALVRHGDVLVAVVRVRARVGVILGGGIGVVLGYVGKVLWVDILHRNVLWWRHRACTDTVRIFLRPNVVKSGEARNSPRKKRSDLQLFKTNCTMPRGRPPGSKNKKTLEAEAAVSKIPLPEDNAPLGSFIKKINKTAETAVAKSEKKRKAEAELKPPPAKRGRGRPPKNAAKGTPKPRGRPPKATSTPKKTASKKSAGTPTPKKGRGRPPKTPTSVAGTPKKTGKKIATPAKSPKALNAAEKEIAALKKKLESLKSTVKTLKSPGAKGSTPKKRGRPAGKAKGKAA